MQMKLHMSFPHLEISLVFKIYIKFHLLSDASTLGGSPVTMANLSVNEDEVNLSMTSSNSAAIIIIIIIIISFIFLRVHQLFCNIADTVSIRINNTLSTQMVQSYAARGAKKEGLS